LEGTAGMLFGREGTEYDLPFADVDAATIGIELDDFAAAVLERRSPEIDGIGGLLAVAAVWAVAESREAGESVRVADVAEGTVSAAQDHLDEKLGLRTETSGEVART